MKKTLKTKVLAGTVTVALLSSAGFAFAATDAGGALQEWYNNEFGKAKGTIAVASAKYAGVETGKAVLEYQFKTKPNAGKAIDENKNNEIKQAQNAISTEANKHVTAVNKKKEEILGNMDSQFEAIISDSKELIAKAGSEALASAEKDLGAYTDGKGRKALEEVTSKIDEAQKTAYKQLDDAIKGAKGTISQRLTAETSETISAINAAVDSEIKRVKDEVAKIVTELVKAQNEIVTAQADKLEGEAIASLEGLVNGINK